MPTYQTYRAGDELPSGTHLVMTNGTAEIAVGLPGESAADVAKSARARIIIIESQRRQERVRKSRESLPDWGSDIEGT